MNLFQGAAHLAGIGLLLGVQLNLPAQTLATLYSFNGGDGENPAATLLLSGNTLYGTTANGGSSGSGTVFKVNRDGTGFTNLHSFSGSDGANPQAGLTISGNTLYGTTANGGNPSVGAGALFAINTDGAGFTNLYYFTNGVDGGFPYCTLLLSGNALFGTTGSGGTTGLGTLFAINTNGTGFKVVYSFDQNSPHDGVVLSDGIFYGTTPNGGAGGGAVFAVNTNGTGFTNLYFFLSGSDGSGPYGGLTLSNHVLYGTTTSGGGLAGNGTVFALNTDGTGYRILWGFTRGSDGANPAAGLMLSGNMLYGTTQVGGDFDVGTVFALTTDGSVFTNLHSFAGSPGEGNDPTAGLLLSGTTLYGTTYSGGAATNGTVFSLALGAVNQPQLSIVGSGTSVILTWPADVTGFILQSTTNLVSPAVWTPVSSAPVVVNGQNTVTNPASGTAQFFRLSQ